MVKLFRSEYVKRFESDIGTFLSDVETYEEKMAKIERLRAVIDLMQGVKKTGPTSE